MKRQIIIITALVLCPQFLGSQNFTSRQLEYIASLLKCPLPVQSSVFHCPAISPLPLKVEYNTAGAVIHLGLSLFADSLKNNVLTKPLYDFQERLFLDVFLQGDESKAQKLLQEYKVRLSNEGNILGTFYQQVGNGLRLALSDSVEYVMTKDSLIWTSSWQFENSSFVLRFPANYDLISGMDKKEAELWFAGQLQKHIGKSVTGNPLNEEGALKSLNDNVLVKYGTHLHIKEMNSNLYFGLLFDRRFPEESVYNLFNHPDTNAEGLILQIHQANYSNDSLSYKVKLYDFQSYMSENNCDVFTGIEKCTADKLEFTVIYRSRFYNCLHLLFVQTTPENMFEKNEPLKATLHTFIPNQNIKNLYKQYRESDHKIPVKIKE